MSPSSGRSKRGSAPSGTSAPNAHDVDPNTGDLFDAASLPVPKLSELPVPELPAPPAQRNPALITEPKQAAAPPTLPEPEPHQATAPPAPPANTAALLRTLKGWSSQGWLRRLDSAFAGFMLDLSPDAPPPVVMAAALVAHMEGRGHSCLLVDRLFRDPEALIGWGPEAAVEFHTVATVFAFRLEDWLDALRTSPLVWVDEWLSKPSQADANQPLVLRGEKLYLRRYWRYERLVAARVLQRASAPIAVDQEKARAWLDRLFPAAGPVSPIRSHSQLHRVDAVHHVRQGDRFRKVDRVRDFD
jgi:hypothetical protein